MRSGKKVFSAFLERAARDVARLQNKEILVVFQGADCELDKTILEQLADPLVHVIRNAVDHGIESASKRVALNKSAAGTIIVSAIKTEQTH